MCAIFGLISLLPFEKVQIFYNEVMMKHRGPDATGKWSSPTGDALLIHHRLSIIDFNDRANQPMVHASGLVIVFNGEVYNYRELKKTILVDYSFKTESDTEVILALYERYSQECVNYLHGMFAFTIWDEKKKTLFCARDRFGIKPFYYCIMKNQFIFASEIKALLPFQEQAELNHEALADYFHFQYYLDDQTLFKGIKQLMPASTLVIHKSSITIKKYWKLEYIEDHSHSSAYFEEKISELLTQSVKKHFVGDVQIGSYLSGGIDSSIITILAAQEKSKFYGSFHGRFLEGRDFDESAYAYSVANQINRPLYTLDISPIDFTDHLNDMIYFLDQPIVGPGAFPQYMVSKLVSEHVKVVMGGQGADELFGGYVRYFLGCFDQVVSIGVDANQKNIFESGNNINFKNLMLLKQYKPLLKSFLSQGSFESFDKRYYALINRANSYTNEINWNEVHSENIFDKFREKFHEKDGGSSLSPLNKMLKFDLNYFLPALLHVEDRMTMAHGIESRVPFLDHELVEFVASIPTHIKFEEGNLKNILKKSFSSQLPEKVSNRVDKMGFPVPLKNWFSGDLKSFIHDVFSSRKAQEREVYNAKFLLKNINESSDYSRRIWSLLCLELWMKKFIDSSSISNKKEIIGIIN